MNKRDLRLLPRFADGLTFLYVEHVRVEREDSAVVLMDASGTVSVPVASLACLLLGPGASFTHAAIAVCAENGCSVCFCGDGGVKFYASGNGETRSSSNLLAQARAWSDATLHLQVVRRMYAMRFASEPAEDATIEQIRGLEGVRVRAAYEAEAEKSGVVWEGRSYSKEWTASTAVNRALSTANACLYGLCHAAIVGVGMSPGLGFVHTGKILSFVYDIADLYKTRVTVPIAFRCAKETSLDDLDKMVRKTCRDEFKRTRLVERIVPDIQRCLGLRQDAAHLIDLSGEEPQGKLWGPDTNVVGERNYGGCA